MQLVYNRSNVKILPKDILGPNEIHLNDSTGMVYKQILKKFCNDSKH